MIYTKAWLRAIFLILVIKMATAHTYQNTTTKSTVVWTRLGRIVGLFLHGCWSATAHKPQQELLMSTQKCLQHKTSTALNRILRSNVTEIWDGVKFVKYRDLNDNFSRVSAEKEGGKEQLDWESQLRQGIADILETHLLQIRLKNLVTHDLEKGRNRRRRNNMMPFMIFGVVGMGLILIPMGFKFLAVLGGKALLLAKMALILTSIQGLKKVATSGINYGLYHSPPSNPWQYDRQWYQDNPKSNIHVEGHVGYGTDDITDEQLDLWRKPHMRS